MGIKKKSFLLLVALIVVYLAITFAIPPDPASAVRYNVSLTYLRLIGLTFTVPIILIWVSAFFGFSRFKDYALKIKDSPDGLALDKVATGLMVLAIGMPITSIFSAILNFYGRTRADLVPMIVILNVYMALAVALVAYTLTRKGSELFINITKKPVALNTKIIVAILTVIVWLVYLYFTLKNPNRTAPVAPATRATFYLPDWAILLTVAIPYLYVWFSGFMSAANISSYKTNTNGQIYKNAMGYLAIGIATVIISSVSTQFLGALSPALQALSLNALLFLVYVLIIIIGVGYFLVAVGAKKLSKIEEV